MTRNFAYQTMVVTLLKRLRKRLKNVKLGVLTAMQLKHQRTKNGTMTAKKLTWTSQASP